MLGVTLHFDFFVSWELLRPNLERRISLNVFSCDYGDSGSEIGITFFTAAYWRSRRHQKKVRAHMPCKVPKHPADLARSQDVQTAA